jgi:tight adherence protein B
MSIFGVSLASGALFFIAVYLSFDRIYLAVWGRLRRVSEDTLVAYEDLFFKRTLNQVIATQTIVGGLVACTIFYLFRSAPLPAVVGALGGFYYAWRLPGYYMNNILRRRRVADFSVQMVDGLTLMGNALKSGMNLAQSLKIVVDEMQGPISQEFRLILDNNRIGQTLEVGFDNLARRLPSEDVQMFVTSVNILKETGGNMAETFQTITATIRERIKLNSKIEAMTAQGKSAAAIVSALPWGLGALLYAIDPILMGPLFFHPAGWGILFVVMLLQITAFMLIKKITTIRV